jgi:UDP-glucose 4-epimerase
VVTVALTPADAVQKVLLNTIMGDGGLISYYQNRRVLVTGGLGFIGSNLSVRLAAAGARVVAVDSSVAGCGANRYNLEGARGIRAIPGDVGSPELFADEIRAAEIVFNLAGEVSHIHSMCQPSRDAELNAGAQLRFLDGCAGLNPGLRVVYASTRQIYGAPRYLPVDEAHPILPVDFNGVHKYAATRYHLLYSEMGRLDTRVLCLTNVYGPRMALHIPGQGFLGSFLRRVLCGQRLEVFGDGHQLRDPVFVDDAVSAFLAAGAVQDPPTRLWNVGGVEALSLGYIAHAVSAAAGVGPPVFRPFPPEHKSIDIGSYTTDSSRILRDLGWRPQVRFRQGMARSLEFFRREWEHYLPGLVPPVLPAVEPLDPSVDARVGPPLPAGSFEPDAPGARRIAV